VSDPSTPKDVTILGAGAAGLFAAIRAAERGRSVLLLEKNRRPGVKILMSGGTRCNITNARGLRDLRVVSGPIDPAYDSRQTRGSRSIQQAFGDAGGRFLGPALRAFTVEQTVQFFESEGLKTKVEANGKVFPECDRATEVLGAILRRLERSRAELQINSPALDVERTGDGFLVHTPGGPIETRWVLVAVGGQSYPGCGTTGDGYAIARKFGHTIVPPRPALVPLRVDADWVHELRGTTVPDVEAIVVDADGRRLASRREAMLFAHFGLTGPAVLDVSRTVARHERPDSLTLVVDLLPDIQAEALDSQLAAQARQGRARVATLLGEHVSHRLAEALAVASGVPSDRVGPELSRDERRRLVATVKGLRLPIAGTLGFAKAEVTSGGVSLDEVDPTTLESKLVPGLHFVGEVLDLDGQIGGYNFQAAWSGGWLVGSVLSGVP
jgi:predicted Rossmann fold flavoprotein